MTMKLSSIVAIAALTLAPAVGSAATITINTFNAANHYINAMPNAVTETFETLGTAMGEGEVGASIVTAVGTFSSAGGTGSGGTVTQLPGNTGTELALRDGNVYGRSNTTPGGDWFLDSNDTYGMNWAVSTGSAFNRIIFTLSDGSDTGAYLRISAGGASVEQRVGGRLPNGNTSVVEIVFSTKVSSANIALLNYTQSGGTTLRRNDGFSVDDVAVAALPLPAALPMFLAALGGMAVIRRRQKSAA